ncbi:class Ib ribonucleoside-diphosphate reductase assembly flavoprotein NrdI [Mycolicibacterium sp.]|uniref:class Ib ribonucleoside-diphosphate reductase assembly flavoprotein NrdI n=1 Tax=Mycolicibacterium sp. TaxID=2320850 RepID=UPI0037CC8274
MNPDGSPSLAGPERLVYFSSVSENTHRFVQKLGVPAIRIPLHERIEVHQPYVLLLPTYGRGRGDSPTLDAKGYVPKQVIRFLNNPHNRSHIRAVVGAGNTQFGAEYCFAARLVSHKCKVRLLYRFEMMGTAEDVEAVRAELTKFWKDEDTCHLQSQLLSL